MNKATRRDAALVTVLALAALFLTIGDVRRLTCTTGGEPAQFDERRFGSPRGAGAMRLSLGDGCIETAAGIFVAPHGECQVEISLRRDPGEHGRIKLGILLPDGVHNELTQTGADGSSTLLGRDVFISHEIDLPILPRALERPELVLISRNGSDVPGRIIHEAKYATYADASACLVDFRRLFAAWGAVLTCVFVLWKIRRAPAGESRQIVLTSAALWMIGLVAVFLRYPFLKAAVNSKLDPDAIGYRSYADSISLFSPMGFFSGRFGYREPLYLFLSHLFFKVFGSSDLHLRYVSFLCAIAVPYLAYWLARAAGARRIPSLIAALMLAIGNPDLLFLATRGLRDDLFMMVVGLFVLALCVAAGHQSNWRWVPVAALGMLCVWTRAISIAFALPLLGWFCVEGFLHRAHLERLGWVKRWRVWESVACVAVMFLAFLPIRLAWKQLHGYSDYPERTYARWYANIEFPERIGTPGYPDRESYQIRKDSGPPLTAAAYAFRLHKPADVVKGSLKGCLGLIRSFAPSIGNAALFNAAIAFCFNVLLIGSFFFARSRLIAMAAISSLVHTGFLYDRRMMEGRMTYHALLLLSVAVCLTGDLAVAKFADNRSGLRRAMERFRLFAAPAISTRRAVFAMVLLGGVAAAAMAIRWPALPPSPNAACLALRGLYWKLSTIVPWSVAVSLPAVPIAIALGAAMIAGIRAAGAIPVIAAGSIVGILATPPAVFSGPTPRTYLWQHSDVAERAIELDESMLGRPVRIRGYLREPFRASASPFSYRIELNGHAIATIASSGRCDGCVGYRWRDFDVAPAMLVKGENTIRVSGVTDGDLSTGYMEIGRVPRWRMGSSSFNGNASDLSPDGGAKGGTLLIGFSFPASGQRGAIPLWLGK